MRNITFTPNGGRPFVFTRRVRPDQCQQTHQPRHHALHLVEKLALAGPAVGQIEAKVFLFHPAVVPAARASRQGVRAGFEHHPWA